MVVVGVVRVLSYVRYKSSPANGDEGSRRKRPQGYEREDQQDYPSEGVNERREEGGNAKEPISNFKIEV